MLDLNSSHHSGENLEMLHLFVNYKDRNFWPLCNVILAMEEQKRIHYYDILKLLGLKENLNIFFLRVGGK